MKRVVAACAVVVAALVIVFLVLASRGHDAMKKSDEALAKGDFASAIVFAERAAQAHVVFSPYPDEGYARLGAVADERAAAGDVATARAALRAIIVASQTTGEADAPRVRDARDRLAKLDPKAPAEAPGTDLAPSSATRVVLALGVVLMALGLATVRRSARLGWALLAAGVLGVLAAALS